MSDNTTLLRPKGRRKAPTRSTRPSAPSNGPTKNTSPGGSTRSSSRSSSSSGKGSTGGGADGAEKRAVKRQEERDKRTGERYLEQALNLQPQAKAYLTAAGNIVKRRRRDIGDITRTRRAQLRQLVRGAEILGEGYDEAAENNEMAAETTLGQSFTNMVREHQEAMMQVITQGAGETDAMRALLMGLRNQNFTASEATRGYRDTLASINQNINNLNVDTQAKLASAWVAGEGEKEQIWRDYYESRGEVLTQLGQIRTAQADAYANAREYEVEPPILGKKKYTHRKEVKEDEGEESEEGGSGKKKKKGKRVPGIPADRLRRKQAKRAFNEWADMQDESYKQKGLPKWIKKYKGMAEKEPTLQNSNLAAAPSVEKLRKAEGAELRKWA